MRVLGEERVATRLAAEVDGLALVLDRRRRLATAATVMPQIGSTATVAAGGRRRRPCAAGRAPASSSSRRTATIWARIESAISPGVRAPISIPAGTSIRSSAPRRRRRRAARRGRRRRACGWRRGRRRQAGVEPQAQRVQLVAPVAGDDHARGRRRRRVAAGDHLAARPAAPSARTASGDRRLAEHHAPAAPAATARGRPRSRRPTGTGS